MSSLDFAGFNFAGLSATTRRVFFGVWILVAMAMVTWWMATSSPKDIWFSLTIGVLVVITILMVVWTIRNPAKAKDEVTKRE